MRFGEAMTTRRARTGNLLAMRAEAGERIDIIPASRFPIQHGIQRLQKELNDFNERIIELENEGYRPCDGGLEGKGSRLCKANR